MKDIYICTSTQAVGSRVNRHFADVAPHYISIMHLCCFPVALARQWLMQPIQCREQLSLTLTKKKESRDVSPVAISISLVMKHIAKAEFSSLY